MRPFRGRRTLPRQTAKSLRKPVLEALEDRTLPSFVAPILYPTGSAPTGLVTGDFNGDGALDVVTANRQSSDVSVLLGNGDGSFRPPVNYPAGTAPFAVAAADLTGNGILDLVVADSGNPDGTKSGISVLLGNGDGTFRATVSFDAGISLHSVAVGDFNGDGIPDLVAADNGTPLANTGAAVLVFQGNGDGSFQAPVTYDAGVGPRSVAVGDFNHDGILDLAVANNGSFPSNYADASVSVLLGNGDGTFQAAVNYPTGPETYAVAVAELTGDGTSDLIAANAGSFGGNSTVSVLRGRGDGTFQDAVNYDVVAGAQAVAVGDFNGDGTPDLVVASGSFNNGAVNVLLGNGDGTFQTAVSFGVGSFPADVAVGDFNGDGALDFVTANAGAGVANVSVVLGNGDGSFRVGHSYAAGSTADSVAVADLNGDGIPDLVDASLFNGTVNVLLGNGDGTFRPAGSYAAGASPGSVAVGDFNSDGIPDLVVANNAPNGTVSVLLGNGDGTFRAPVSYSVGSSPGFVAVGDFNGDGSPDLAVGTNTGGGNAELLLGNGDGTFQAPVVVAQGGGLAAVGDFNGDGIPDLLTSNYSTGTVGVLFGNGNGTFQAPVATALGQLSAVLGVGDVNGDGIPDLLVSSAFHRYVTVWLGVGDGTFQRGGSFDTGSLPAAAAVGDVNGDGIPDLVLVSNGGGTVNVLLGNGDGSFGAAPVYYDNFSPTTVVLADVNGDGFPDVVTSNFGADGVTVLLNGADWPAAPAPRRTTLAVRGQLPGDALESARPGAVDGFVPQPEAAPSSALPVPDRAGPSGAPETQRLATATEDRLRPPRVELVDQGMALKDSDLTPSPGVATPGLERDHELGEGVP